MDQLVPEKSKENLPVPKLSMLQSFLHPKGWKLSNSALKPDSVPLKSGKSLDYRLIIPLSIVSF